jgi:cysteine protease ATG4
LLTAAKHGKGHLDKAMRYLLDSDAMPDKCADPIWLLGVQHPGYEPPLSALPNVVATSPGSNSNNPNHSSLGLPFRRSSASSTSFRSSTSSLASSELSQSTNSLSSKTPNPAANWPPVFYIDFTSRIWLTYRSQFPVPIKDGRLADLCDTDGSGGGGGGGCNNEPSEGLSAASSPTTVKSRPWNWVSVVGGEKTWTSDSGWGCMLRTGQSLLANALIHMHLGRGLSLQKTINS